MPETGFSLARIRTHLRRWLGLYLAATIALCFANHLIFTVTRPQPTQAQTLRIMVMNAEFAPDEKRLLEKIQAVDGAICALELEYLPYASAGDSTSVMLFSAKLIGGTGDVFVTNEEGFSLLKGRGAMVEYIESKNIYITAVTEEAKAFLPAVAEEIKGVQG